MGGPTGTHLTAGRTASAGIVWPTGYRVVR